ncbi:hypothetical protein DND132_2524 [Pseudodesulfovibrio mercurii]|uniref:Lipoprotein n=1 Tax=Pseudodesulfovibrio mercurii TaxID=641491 RepID=F0JCP7_9BACT|nr:hypothetical protein [Pseudodesulfovibrio mercurii]EGB15727.1 hypothetical protein DND132_2524 [Pseudodesulfovibrio mercurii]
MNKILRLLTVIAVALLLGGCVSSMPRSGLSMEPMAPTYAAMPETDAAIATAVAVQGATPALGAYGQVRFDPGAAGLSEPDLGLQGFEFTEAKLYAARPPRGGAPGLSMGEVELTDPLGRRTGYLYRAEYAPDGAALRLTSLRMEPIYCADPRVDVTVLRAGDLPKGPMTYAQLVRVLSRKGLTLSQLTEAGPGDYAIVALGRDRVGPGAELTIAVSAKATGSGGHSVGSGSSLLEGRWPVAVLVGNLAPNGSRKLYAKVSFKAEPGRAKPRTIGVYQIAAFGN